MLAGQHQVGRLDVAMNQAHAVSGHQRAGHLQRQLESIGGGQRPAARDELLEGLTLDALHRVEILFHALVAEVKNGGDVGMSQLRRGARLAQESLPGGIVCEVGGLMTLSTAGLRRFVSKAL